ncbi:hypothetical protein [Borreliella burgdorferi]|nr:hypothetical protein [Borreliella burgdorferi]PRQ90872.1 hypothetical protein CV691_05520 [Borreliella burgdorferi]PRR13754.1 hypothetical protein CV656_05755 [Borreliella burgdorferi]PRR15850.1 hypothetical protein CV649_05475 [Borreliella burgdorferi]PRR19502.1 hypothetical protein CV647_05270 [Borreliella burgdorferi]PRR23138.1 hypothetical protein CV646_05440 [Borreliella burgdorferi]
MLESETKVSELKKSLDFSEESLSLKSLDIEQLSIRDIRFIYE